MLTYFFKMAYFDMCTKNFTLILFYNILYLLLFTFYLSIKLNIKLKKYMRVFTLILFYNINVNFFIHISKYAILKKYVNI